MAKPWERLYGSARRMWQREEANAPRARTPPWLPLISSPPRRFSHRAEQRPARERLPAPALQGQSGPAAPAQQPPRAAADRPSPPRLPAARPPRPPWVSQAGKTSAVLEPTWLLVPWLKTTAADPVDWGLSADPPPLSQDLESFRQLRHNPSGLLRRSSLPQNRPAPREERACRGGWLTTSGLSVHG